MARGEKVKPPVSAYTHNTGLQYKLRSAQYNKSNTVVLYYLNYHSADSVRIRLVWYTRRKG